MPNNIQVPSVAQRLTYLFRLFGRVRLSLADEVLPVAVVADEQVTQLPAIRRYCCTQATQPAVAGELATFSFQVPPTIIARIRRITLQGATDQVFDFKLRSSVNTAGFTTVGARFFDERLQVLGQTPAGSTLRGTQAAGISNVNMRRFFSATAPAPQDVDIYVGSGDPTNFGFLEIQADAANEQVILLMEWDEYELAVPQAG